MRERLHSYALAYANSDFARDGSLVPPFEVPDPRFRRPGSGLYAQIVFPSGRWESDSAQGPRLPVGPMLDARQQAFEGPLPVTQINGQSGEVYRYGYGLIWSGSDQQGASFPTPCTSSKTPPRWAGRSRRSARPCG